MGAELVAALPNAPQVGPGIPVMHLVPRESWWIATFWAPGEVDWLVTFDISTPPLLADGVWTYVDLEVDVDVDGANQEVHLQDENEFQAAVDLGLISPEEARRGSTRGR